jgi:hypothetical protein
MTVAQSIAIVPQGVVHGSCQGDAHNAANGSLYEQMSSRRSRCEASHCHGSTLQKDDGDSKAERHLQANKVFDINLPQSAVSRFLTRHSWQNAFSAWPLRQSRQAKSCACPSPINRHPNILFLGELQEAAI